MASVLLHSTFRLNCHNLPLPLPRLNFFSFQHKPIVKNPQSFPTFLHPGHPKIVVTRTSPDDFLRIIEKDESLSMSEEKPAKFLLWALLWASVSIGLHALCGDARAAAALGVGVDVGADTIRGSGFGVKVANALRASGSLQKIEFLATHECVANFCSGWPGEAVVFALATLPVIELRGAIPVGYWLQLDPIFLTVLSVLGNMVPVPFIILYLKKLTSFLTGKNAAASRLLDVLFESAKQKAGPVQEFQWLGLMLFVAVPFPGTGAWTGAFIASILDMPFWQALTANFVGVVLAGLLVNLLVNLGLMYAVVSAMMMFVVSTFMWSILRGLKKSLKSSDDAK